jgi:hypothetical protein
VVAFITTNAAQNNGRNIYHLPEYTLEFNRMFKVIGVHILDRTRSL